MRVFCPTRWTVKADTLKSIIENYEVLMEVREGSLESAKDTEKRARIRGVSLYMRKFDFLFGAMVGECLLRHSDNLSKAQQSQVLCAAEGQRTVVLTLATLEALRKDDKFALFWELVKKKAAML